MCYFFPKEKHIGYYIFIWRWNDKKTEKVFLNAVKGDKFVIAPPKTRLPGIASSREPDPPPLLPPPLPAPPLPAPPPKLPPPLPPPNPLGQKMRFKCVLRGAAKKLYFTCLTNTLVGTFFSRLQKSFFFLVARPLSPPPLSGRATRTFLRLLLLIYVCTSNAIDI